MSDTSRTEPTLPAWRPAEPFRFLRARNARLGGVAGGLAAAAGVDPTLVRLAVALGCLTGVGLLAYVVAWAVVPQEDPATGRGLRRAPDGTARAVRTGLAVMAVLGTLRFLGGLLNLLLFPITLVTGVFGDAVRFDVPAGTGPGWRATIGLILVVVGLVSLLRRRWSPPASAGTAGGPEAARVVGGSGSPDAPPPGSPPPGWPSAGGPGGPAMFTAGEGDAAAPTGRGEWRLLAARVLGWLAMLWFLGAAAVGTALWLSGGVDVRVPGVVIAMALAALVGLGMALFKTRRPAMVLMATGALLLPALVGAVLIRWEGQAGSRTLRPETAADLSPRYRHFAGELNLDLSDLRLEPGTTHSIDARIAAGQLRVTVPWDATVSVRTRVGIGTVELFGTDDSGAGVRVARRSEGELEGPVLQLWLRAGIGRVEVQRFVRATQEALDRGFPVTMACAPADGGIRCQSPDGVTTPELDCGVPADAAKFPKPATCAPVGSPQDIAGLAAEQRLQFCHVPAGGGIATCQDPPAAPADPPAPFDPMTPTERPAEMICSIPPGGGTADCHPGDPSATYPPPNTSSGPAARSEYVCSVPPSGGPAECRSR